MTAPAIPARMTAIGISEPGGPEVLAPVEREVPEPAPGEVLVAVEAAGGEPPGRNAAPGPLPAAARRIGHSRAGNRGHGGGARRRRRHSGDRVAGVRARHRRRIRRVLHRGGAPLCLPMPAGLDARPRAAALPGDVLHGMDQRLRFAPRLSEGESLLVHGGSSGIGTHRDPARPGVRRDRSTSPRARRRSATPAWRSGRTRPSATAKTTSSSGSAPSPAGAGSTWCST